MFHIIVRNDVKTVINGESMLKYQCFSCQNIIHWKDGKKLISEDHIICKNCGAILVYNNKAKLLTSILYIILFSLFTLGIYLLHDIPSAPIISFLSFALILLLSCFSTQIERISSSFFSLLFTLPLKHEQPESKEL